MPILNGIPGSAVRAVNTTMARGFFPRSKKWIYPELSGTTISTSLIEPFTLLGAIPQLSKYNGFLQSSLITSYVQNVPNVLFKNLIAIQQQTYEGDQTKIILKYSAALGIRVAEFPDLLWSQKLLTASTASSAFEVFGGQTYTLTFDGLSFFNRYHPTGLGGLQSNIVQGTLPLTSAAVAAQDLPTTATQLVQTYSLILARMMGIRDTQGQLIFPTLDAKKSIVVVVPPILQMAADLAFRPQENPQIISNTYNVAPQYVKKVITSGMLQGFIDPTTGNNIAPLNETDFYVFIVDDDYGKPFYMQLFRPPRQDEVFPLGQSVPDPIDRILQEDGGLSVAQATLFASTRIDTTFNRIGANSDAFTIQTEQFLMSGRYRGNMTYGLWFLGYRAIPVGGTYNN